VADTTGDGPEEILTAPGPGAGPHARVFRVTAAVGVLEVASFFAYPPGDAAGLFVAAGP
jgi:hypothetical protein